MSDYDHMCTECDRKPCIELGPKMAVPRELHTDYEMMVTANLLMATSIDSLKRKGEQLEAENAKLLEDLEFERSENGWAREFLNRMGRKCGTKDCPSLVAYVTKLENENAKLLDENTELRKLGGFMLRCISQYHDCADCLVNGEHCEISYIEADARELGIEVDE